MKLCSIDGCDNKFLARGWCRKHYYRWKRHGDPNTLLQEHYDTPEESFEARTVPVTETGCLLWTGATIENRYGVITINGRNILVHRYAWEKANGEIPEGLHIDHKCHTTMCANSDHLRPATNAQNMQYQSGLAAHNISGHRNVYWHKVLQKWHVSLKCNSRAYSYGFFTDLEEAAIVAEEARRELYGEFAGKG